MYSRLFGRAKVILVGQFLILFRHYRNGMVQLESTWMLLVHVYSANVIHVNWHMCDFTRKPYSTQYCTVRSWLVSSDCRRLHNQDHDCDQLHVSKAKIFDSRAWVFVATVLSSNRATLYNLYSVVLERFEDESMAARKDLRLIIKLLCCTWLVMIVPLNV